MSKVLGIILYGFSKDVGGGGGGPTGDGLLLEDGSSFLLAEDNSFLVLE